MPSMLFLVITGTLLSMGVTNAFSRPQLLMERSRHCYVSTKLQAVPADSKKSVTSSRKPRDKERVEWINRSVEYYAKVMREERRRALGQSNEGNESKEEFVTLAKKHYFARYKIKSGRPQHAEHIYRRIIDELSQEDEGHCDHAKLAVTTLLLALLLQRQGDMKGTRSVFLNFFRFVVMDMDSTAECACSAKVLQAFALFEMKRGNTQKSLKLALRAIDLDQSLHSILNWKQFRDAKLRNDAYEGLSIRKGD
jgi:hypothetical protein